jgi:nucleoside-diphosphate-sugar epimerase
MKRFVEQDFQRRFDTRIDIKNAEYILKRYSTQVCIVGASGFIGRHIAANFPGAVCVTRSNFHHVFERPYELIINCAAVGGSRMKPDDESVYYENVNTFTNIYKNARYTHMIWFSSGAASKDTPYGRSKKHIEDMVKDDPRIITLKIWGCFGLGEPEYRLLATAKRAGKVIIDKDRLFDYIHVSKVVQMIFTIIEMEFQCPRYIHMCYREKYLLSEVVKMAGYQCSVLSPDLDEPYIGTSMISGSLEEDLKM